VENKFKISSQFEPSGDQPQAIKKLVAGLNADKRNQVLLGVTGSGKTFTMAQIIQETQRPAIIMAHNKTLAAQLYSEMKGFFPDNAVEYFVSYYDYYQPEAYMPQKDVFIEKDSSINDQIDRMRHAATRSLLERRDVIIIASVSCIYGIGDAASYSEMTITLKTGQLIDRENLIKQLTELQYKRNDIEFERGTFRVKGDTVDIFPAHYENSAWRVSMFGDEVEEITEFDPLTGEKHASLDWVRIFPKSHFVTPRPAIQQAKKAIKAELKDRLAELESLEKKVEYQRLEQRTMFDLEMIEETGFCKGIENYSRHLTGKKKGEPPPTLFQYFPDDAILFADESHVTIPQIGGMYNGDRARKMNLSEFGFRLPSCMDNRPLKFEEWDEMRPQTIFVSATPREFELEKSEGEIVEQLIRPTGLIDPECDVRPLETQVDDLLKECKIRAKKNERVLVTAITKKMAEHLTEYMLDAGLKVSYIHSDVETLERIEIIRDLRLGKYDVLVGVNLLREGLDIPECTLVAILDADKEGFLRSKTSLIQTIGRAARNVDGKVILYADRITNSMEGALSETSRRREVQKQYNKDNGITPETIKSHIRDVLGSVYEHDYYTIDVNTPIMSVKEIEKQIEKLHKSMIDAANNLDFEKATKLRDEISKLEEMEL